MKTWDLVLGASLAGAPRGAGLSFRVCCPGSFHSLCATRPPCRQRARSREAEDVPGREGRRGPHRAAAPASVLPRPPSQGPRALFGAIGGGRLTQDDGTAGPGFRQLPRLSPPGGPVPAPTDGFYSIGKAKTRKERGGWEPTRPHRPCQPALSKVTVRQTGRCHTGFR